MDGNNWLVHLCVTKRMSDGHTVMLFWPFLTIPFAVCQTAVRLFLALVSEIVKKGMKQAMYRTAKYFFCVFCVKHENTLVQETIEVFFPPSPKLGWVIFLSCRRGSLSTELNWVFVVSWTQIVEASSTSMLKQSTQAAHFYIKSAQMELWIQWDHRKTLSFY